MMTDDIVVLITCLLLLLSSSLPDAIAAASSQHRAASRNAAETCMTSGQQVALHVNGQCTVCMAACWISMTVNTLVDKFEWCGCGPPVQSPKGLHMQIVN